MSFTSSPAFYYSQFSRTKDDGASPLAQTEGPERSESPADLALRRMIEQYEELYKLRHAATLVPLIETWRVLDAMGAAEEKQRLLEPLIQQVQRHPEEHEAELIFILLVLEPIRRSVCRKLLSGLPLGSSAEPDRHRRQEARWLNDMERDHFYSATRSIVLQLVHSYSFQVRPGGIFAWFKGALSRQVMALYRREYLSENGALTPFERERLARFLQGIDALEPEEMRNAPGYRAWLHRLADLRPVFSAVDEYRERPEVQRACRDATGRLSTRRRDVILAYFYDGLSLEQIAKRDGVAVSTVGNTKNQAEEKLRADDLFYCALDALGLIRNEARRQEIAGKYPQGIRPDGKRIVWVAG